MHDAVADDDDGRAGDGGVATLHVEPGVDGSIGRWPARDGGGRGADEDVGRDDGDGSGDDDEAESAVEARHRGRAPWQGRRGKGRSAMGAGASSDIRTVAPDAPPAIPREAEPDLPHQDDRSPFRPPRGPGIEHASTRTLGPMDLHVVGPAATPDERAAIDAALDPEIGPARGGWDGGPRDIATEGHIAHGGHDARARRDLLLPALEAAAGARGLGQSRALNHICKRLAVPPAEAYGVATFYALLSTTPRPPLVAHVCDDLACRLLGAERICAMSWSAARPTGGRRPRGCDVAPEPVPRPVRARAGGARHVSRADAQGPRPRHRPRRGRRREHARRRSALSPALDRPTSVDAGELAPPVGDRPRSGCWRASGGRPDVARRLPRVRRLSRRCEGARAIGPAARHRGGHRVEAGGPRRRGVPDRPKWEAVARAAGQPHYVVCNADESEPGTFKDRVLMEDDPFAVSRR